MSQVTTAVPKPEADALETLHAEAMRASQAYAAIQKRVADGGKVQRLAPGVWVITREAPESE